MDKASFDVFYEIATREVGGVVAADVMDGWIAEDGKDFEGGRLIAFPLSHQLIADFVNANRVTVTKCMQILKKEGLIRRINNTYDIPDIERLRRHQKMQTNSN